MLDGTLITTDRCASAPVGYAGENQDPYYSGKHHRHGVNVQGVIGLDGELLFLGEATRLRPTQGVQGPPTRTDQPTPERHPRPLNPQRHQAAYITCRGIDRRGSGCARVLASKSPCHGQFGDPVHGPATQHELLRVDREPQPGKTLEQDRQADLQLGTRE